MTETVSMTELELAMRKLAHQVKLDTLEACADIAESIDSGRGNEKQIAAAIRALVVSRPHQPSPEAK